MNIYENIEVFKIYVSEHEGEIEKARVQAVRAETAANQAVSAKNIVEPHLSNIDKVGENMDNVNDVANNQDNINEVAGLELTSSETALTIDAELITLSQLKAELDIL